MLELMRLADTAGLEVVGQMTQKMQKPHPATFVGRGKADEIASMVRTLDADVVIFDDELAPRHQRELERIFGEAIKVMDRTGLILDIFALHASTSEGSLQVELAQYSYRLPRLTQTWTKQALTRQAGGRAGGMSGGVGLRGPGETRLEMDRFAIRQRIAQAKRELETVRASRARHRQQRRRSGLPTVALVGYTNAGKSTLLNALSWRRCLCCRSAFCDTRSHNAPDNPAGRNGRIAHGYCRLYPKTPYGSYRFVSGRPWKRFWKLIYCYILLM